MCDCTSFPLQFRIHSLHKSRPTQFPPHPPPTSFPISTPPPFQITTFTNATQESDEYATVVGTPPSSFDFINRENEDELMLTGNGNEAVEKPMRKWGGRQLMRRSSLLAKQVISMRSACSLGFVSQLWVDARLWVVVLVEVKPSLLSGEVEKILLKDICQVGDVVLVKDETVVENEVKMIGLDTLVGYNVVTTERQNVGKVRGYTFNINSGAVESLELDSFGISIIPASLVSTYCLLVKDVLQVIADTVVVHEGALSRLQRLTKGIWNARKNDLYEDEMVENSNFERQRTRPQRKRSDQKKSSNQEFRRRMREMEDDLELPIDY